MFINLNKQESNTDEDQNDKELEEYCETAPIVKVVNMEMTASCQGGQRSNRPTTPILINPQRYHKFYKI